ncbi:uncharacterized protein ACNLHF_028270 [Anomaloglossus baeobatrachus]
MKTNILLIAFSLCALCHLCYGDCLLTAIEGPDFMEQCKELLSKYNYLTEGSSIAQALIDNFILIEGDIKCDIGQLSRDLNLDGASVETIAEALYKFLCGLTSLTCVPKIWL